MKKLVLVLGMSAVVALASGGFATANGVIGPGQAKDEVILYYQVVETTGSPSSDTGVIDNLGGAIAGGYLGNTANSGVDSDAPDRGHGVNAPSSPGPLVGGCASEPGASLGFSITLNGPAAVPAAEDAGPSC